MTMKTAGQVIGGLHQPLEYNVPRLGPMLELQRLPSQAWPEGLSPPALQSRLKPLFTTDFVREKCRVMQGESQIEVTLDHWQYHEELWLRGDPQAMVGVLEGITLIREIFRVMANLVRRKATTVLLADIMPLIAAERADPQAICYLHVYLQTKPALTSWLMSSVWQNTADEDTHKKLTGAYRPTEVVAYLMHWKALYQSIMQKGPEDGEHLRQPARAQVGFWLK